MNKAVSLALALVLLLCSCAAASGEEASKTWLTEDKQTLTIATHSGWDNFAPKPSNDLLLWQKMEEITNVHIEWQVTPQATYNETMAVRIAALSDLPDIWVHTSGMDFPTLAEDGVIIDQTELWESSYPYTKELFTKAPYDVYLPLMFKEGRFYGVGNIVMPKGQTQGLMINQAWLDKLGLAMPTTTDELLVVLRAFRDLDPNGNGQKDEIPLVTEDYCLDVLANAFGLEYGGVASGYRALEDGTVRYERATAEYKEYLGYAHTLYSEGLLDQEWLGCTYDKIQEYVANDTAGLIIWWIQAAPALSGISPLTEDKSGETPVFVPMLPLDSPNAKGAIYLRMGYGNDDMLITTACKNPELAARWIDFQYASPESMEMIAYGVEGVTYRRADGNIEKILPEEGSWGIKRTEVGGGQQPRGYIQTDEMINATSIDWWVELHNQFAYTEPTVYSLRLTTQERERRTAETPDLGTYQSEMRAKFIRGEESLESYDKYVETLNVLGLPTLIEINQAAYDRQFK